MVNGTGTITCLSIGKWGSSITCQIKGNINLNRIEIGDAINICCIFMKPYQNVMVHEIKAEV